MEMTFKSTVFKSRKVILYATLLFAISLLLVACTKKKQPLPKGIGEPLILGPATKLLLSPDKKTILFLADPISFREKGVSSAVLQGVLQGSLTLFSLEKKQSQVLGKAVSNLDDGFGISADGQHVAFLQNFRFRSQSGELGLASLHGEPKVTILNKHAKFYRFSPDGKKFAYVANGGEMHLLDLKNGNNNILAQNIATFEFSHDSQHILMRKPLAAGGNLLLVSTSLPEEQPQSISLGVAEYSFSFDGKMLAFTSKGEELHGNSYRLNWGTIAAARQKKFFKIGEKVTRFRFSPDNQWIAYEDGAGPDHPLGKLNTVNVFGEEPKTIGLNVFEYRWSPQSHAIALRENNEEKGRKWITLKVVSPTGKIEHQESWTPSEKLERIPMTWSPDGKYLAFMRAVYKPVFSPNLYVYGAGQKTKQIAQWAFGFQFAPGKEEIWYQTDCVRGGRECNLLSKPLEDAHSTSRKLAAGILSFQSVSNGNRVFLMYPRYENEENIADIGWIDVPSGQSSRGIDQFTHPEVHPIDSQGNTVVYIVKEKGREGVYMAHLK